MFKAKYDDTCPLQRWASALMKSIIFARAGTSNVPIRYAASDLRHIHGDTATGLPTCGVPSFHGALLGVAVRILGGGGCAGPMMPPHQSASCRLGLSPNSSKGCLTGLSSFAWIGLSRIKRASGNGILHTWTGHDKPMPVSSPGSESLPQNPPVPDLKFAGSVMLFSLRCTISGALGAPRKMAAQAAEPLQ